nr:MAG TPA: protein of unknown function DUF3333 [Caudoviricetes sp.]
MICFNLARLNKNHCSRRIFKFYGIVCWHTFAAQTILFLIT